MQSASGGRVKAVLFAHPISIIYPDPLMYLEKKENPLISSWMALNMRNLTQGMVPKSI